MKIVGAITSPARIWLSVTVFHTFANRQMPVSNVW